MRRKIVRDQSIRWGNTPCLAYSNTHAEEEQVPERGRRRTKARKCTPYRKSAGNDSAAAGPIGDKGERDRQNGIEDRERRTAQDTELRVRQLQILDDRSSKDAEDRSV